MRVVEAEIVAQRVKQRHVLVGFDRVGRAVDVERKFLIHDAASSVGAAAFVVGMDRMCRCPKTALRAG